MSTIDSTGTARRWVLPDGIEEWLPPRAARVERLRRALLDLLASWGYELVVPPLLEYLDALLTGVGGDLDLQTFKVIDQQSGRLMGLRADVTSQVARMDAHSLGSDGPARFCYVEPVLHARPATPFESRAPVLIGAELFGAAGPAADAEVIALLAEVLDCVGAPDARIELGHVGIYRAVLAAAALPDAVHTEVFAALQAKSVPDLDLALRDVEVASPALHLLRQLPSLMGTASVLDDAERLLADGPLQARAAISELRAVGEFVAALRPDLHLQYDLCELSGYSYHSGVIFAAYVDGIGKAVARGGRYDGIGREFGRARPATGFDADIGLLAELAPAAVPARCVLAPLLGAEDARAASLRAAVAALRNDGVAVVLAVDGMVGSGVEHLVWDDTRWRVVPAAPGGS